MKANSKKKKTELQNPMELQYSGNVKIQFAHGDKVYKTIKGKNNGRLPLFEFLTYCLIGNYADSKSPRFIRTFKTTSQTSQDTDLTELNSTTKVSIPFTTVDLVKDDQNYYKAVFTFLIPGSVFKENVGTNTFALYSLENVNNFSKCSARINLNEEFSVLDTNTNVIVTWEMSITNKQ